MNYFPRLEPSLPIPDGIPDPSVQSVNPIAGRETFSLYTKGAELDTHAPTTPRAYALEYQHPALWVDRLGKPQEPFFRRIILLDGFSLGILL
jgi:hypothetical protein